MGGDFNTDFRRTTSLHTNTLKLFLETEVMKSGLAHVMSDVDYTYLSKINNVRSIVDHFLLTDNLFNTILTYKSIHGDNLADHSVLQLRLQLPMEYSNSLPIVERREQVRWHNISNDQLERYKSCLDYLLDNVNIPPDLLDCCEYECDAHQCVIEELHNGIVNACLQAGHLTLSHCSDQSRATPVIG